MVNTILVIATVRREPRLLSLKDANFVNDDTCFMVVLFMAWCAIDLAQVFYYRWKGQIGTIVHHGSAFIAWGLYLEGGYGHALSLVGVFCEATNPFMNMRYFLSEAGLKSHPAYMINGGLFCLSWLFVRLSFAMPLGTWMIASQWGSLAGLPMWRRYLYPGFFFVGCVLNVIWGYKLFHGAYKLLTAKEA